MCRFNPDAPVAASWSCRVQSYCPTLNSIGVNSKMNHRYRGWRKAFEKHFGPWLQESVPAALKYRRVIVTRVYGKGKRPYDSGNLIGGCKPLLDTLTNFGAIYDDKDLWCESHYRQEKSLDGLDYLEVRIDEFVE